MPIGELKDLGKWEKDKIVSCCSTHRRDADNTESSSRRCGYMLPPRAGHDGAGVQRAALRRQDNRQPDLCQAPTRASARTAPTIKSQETRQPIQPTPNNPCSLITNGVSLLNRCRSRANRVRRRRRHQRGRSFPRAGGLVALARPAC